jgi:hypothetical protein
VAEGLRVGANVVLLERDDSTLPTVGSRTVPSLTIEVEATSVVVLGHFNPSILSPAWFAAHELIASDDADDADVDAIVRELAAFSTALFEIRCTFDQLVVTTSKAPAPEMVQDLALGTLRLLSHTPVGALGINRTFHVRMPSEETWNALGHRLVPRDNWGFLKEPGMRSLGVQSQRPDELEGRVNVRVEPSARFHPGVFLEVNDHFSVSPTPTSEGCERATAVIADEWAASMARADAIFDSVLNQANGQQA